MVTKSITDVLSSKFFIDMSDTWFVCTTLIICNLMCNFLLYVGDIRILQLRVYIVGSLKQINQLTTVYDVEMHMSTSEPLHQLLY